MVRSRLIAPILASTASDSATLLRLAMEVHRVTLGDFNPWFERRLARKYTPCLAGVVEALTPVLSCFATIRAQAEELGVAMLKEERSPTGVSASDASLPVVRQHVDNSIHLVDRIANSFPECPLDHEFLSGFVKHGRDCLKQLSLNSVSLQQLADAPYNEPSTASRKVLKALTALKLSTIRSALEQLPHDLDALEAQLRTSNPGDPHLNPTPAITQQL